MTLQKRSRFFQLAFKLIISIFILLIISKLIYAFWAIYSSIPAEMSIGVELLSTVKLIKAHFFSNEKYGIILMIMAIVSIFINNKFGWINIAIFSYFYLIDIAISSHAYIYPREYHLNRITDLLVFFPMILVPLMNLKYITESYSIKTSSVLMLNLIPILITSLLIYFRWVLFKDNSISNYVYDMTM